MTPPAGGGCRHRGPDLARSGQTVAGYAVPINHALDIAEQIVAGVDNETIHQGVPAFRRGCG